MTIRMTSRSSPVFGCEPRVFLHRQRRRGHARKREPEPITLRLDDATIISGGVTGQELTMLGEHRLQVCLGKRAEPHRRAADVGLHDDRRPEGRHRVMVPNVGISRYRRASGVMRTEEPINVGVRS